MMAAWLGYSQSQVSFEQETKTKKRKKKRLNTNPKLSRKKIAIMAEDEEPRRGTLSEAAEKDALREPGDWVVLSLLY